MSKESALRLATGNPTVTPNPSLVPSNPPAAAAAATTAEVVAEPPAGATTTDKPVTQPKDDKLSIIIKKEAEIFKAREAIKKQQADLATKEKQYNEVIKRVQDFEDLAKKDKVSALKMLGWSDTDIVNIMNTEPTKPTAEEIAARIAEEKINSFKAEMTEKEKKAAAERDTQLVSNFKNELADTLKKDAEKYKFAAHRGKEAELQAMAIIEQNLKLTNGEELISIEEALQMTNDLFKQDYESARKLFDEPAAAPVEPPRKEMTGKPPVSNIPAPKPKTLTNAVSATATSTPITMNETRAQKRERLIEAIKTHGLRK